MIYEMSYGNNIEEKIEEMLIDNRTLDAYNFLKDELEKFPWKREIIKILSFVCVVCNKYNEANDCINRMGLQVYNEYTYFAKAILLIKENRIKQAMEYFFKIIDREKYSYSHSRWTTLAGQFARLDVLNIKKAAFYFGKMLINENIINEMNEELEESNADEGVIYYMDEPEIYFNIYEDKDLAEMFKLFMSFKNGHWFHYTKFLRNNLLFAKGYIVEFLRKIPPTVVRKRDLRYIIAVLKQIKLDFADFMNYNCWDVDNEGDYEYTYRFLCRGENNVKKIYETKFG